MVWNGVPPPPHPNLDPPSPRPLLRPVGNQVFYAWEHTAEPRSTQAWIIYAVRNGFFAVYTSFAAIGLFAGGIYAADGANQAFGYVVVSVAGGAATHAVGRAVGAQLFGDSPPPDAAGDAGALTAELAETGPGVALAAQTGMLGIAGIIASQWFAAAAGGEGGGDSQADAAVTAVGLFAAAAGVLVGEKLVPDDTRANRRMIVLALLATYAMVTSMTTADYAAAGATPGYSRALAAAVIGEKFVCSFSGSASAYCPTVATVTNEVRKLGVMGGVAAIAKDAVAVLICTVAVAYFASVGPLPPFLV